MTKPLALNAVQPPLLIRLLNQHNDILLAGVIVAVISLMVFPLPPVALDILIGINLAASIALLMLSMYVPSALGLSTFPALLLITTIFRLALNIASTKQILLHAHAGEIIETFGKLIVGGNVVVGIVVFIIIAIVQFIVIAKGSERVAEVGARFTLDAMPGKQMSIDADVRANLITAEEAKARRNKLELESKLHGALDGAMKFVKGDAIAGIIIAAVNILAGITIGVMMKNMSAGEAVSIYAVLTVGDGMVSQIPSLFVSVAAGILITRVANEEEKASHIGGEISRQLMAHPKALLITGVVLLGFVLVPGFPKWVFIVLGGLMFAVGFFLRKESKKLEGYEHTPMPALKKDGTLMIPSFVTPVQDMAFAAPLMLRFPANWYGKISAAQLNDSIEAMKNRIRLDLGVPFPGMIIDFDNNLPHNTYSIWLHEIEYVRELVDLLQTDESNPQEVKVITALERLFRQNAASFVGMQETQNMIKAAEAQYPDLCGEVLRALPLQRVAEVLRRLVDEHISIRHLREILESLISWGMREKDVIALTEYIRVDLGRFTIHKHLDTDKKLQAILLSPEFEDIFRQAIQVSNNEHIMLDPQQSQHLVTELGVLLKGHSDKPVVLLASMDIRRYVKKHLQDFIPSLSVLSYQEVGASIVLQALGQITPMSP
jgi:type III secretion protein V